MNLLEFFGKPIEVNGDHDGHDDPFKLDREERERLVQDVFDFMNHHDNTHKKFFIPIARKIKNSSHEKKINPEIWMPMINSACMEFYKEHKLAGDPLDMFDKQMRSDLCKKCSEFHNKHIILGSYELGK